MPDKITLLTMSDHPMVPSGVGTQTRYILEGLLKTGKYRIISLGGAISHGDYRPMRFEEYKEDWTIFPVNGYGDPDLIREAMNGEKIDAIWFMTDPRFFGWLFNMSDEIRDRNIPILYYHVWDNYPIPKYNKLFYDSCDYIGCISKLTQDIVTTLGCADKSEYIPHAIDGNVFKPLPKDEVAKRRVAMFGEKFKDKFIIFYNSRNARRKMTSDVLKVYKDFSTKVGPENVFLFMHTDPHDVEGANLLAVADMLDLPLNGEHIRFSTERISPEDMNICYNISDVTMNISNNEGFGLSCLESLTSGTPVIVNKTGGLQDQVIDENGNEFGVAVPPASRNLQGSQEIPYILDDRCSHESLVAALEKMYNLSSDERKALGLKGREYSLRAFSMSDMIGKWDNAITSKVREFKEKGYAGRIKLAKV